MTGVDTLRNELQKLENDVISDLRNLIAFESVSAQNRQLDECADFLRELLGKEGFVVDVVKNRDGRPTIIAEYGGGDAKKTILLYNHLDVQPPDPLDEWSSPPFQLVERDGKLYGRGVADNKGDIIARLYAIKLLKELAGELPLRIRWLIESEEEVSSPNLPEVIRENAERLRADACLWEAGDITDEGIPNFCLGVKGILYVEIRTKTMETDKHSMYAPIIPSAPWRLCELLSNMRDKRGRVKIPGFYNGVKKPSREEIRALKNLRFDPGKLASALGVKQFLQRGKMNILRELVFSPTCNIAGLVSGYTGEGSKTIVPAKAAVKIDFRLVPNQDPEKILKALKRFVRRFGDFEVVVHGMEPPARSSPDSEIVKVALSTAREVYGVKPNLWPSIFGTGPMGYITKLRIPTGMLNSLSHYGSNYHAPNENIIKEHLMLSIVHLARMFEEFSRVGSGRA